MSTLEKEFDKLLQRVSRQSKNNMKVSTEDLKALQNLAWQEVENREQWDQSDDSWTDSGCVM